MPPDIFIIHHLCYLVNNFLSKYEYFFVFLLFY
nr:MAG TPA: hypothetical protein [Caudoviricetes sp.]